MQVTSCAHIFLAVVLWYSNNPSIYQSDCSSYQWNHGVTRAGGLCFSKKKKKTFLPQQLAQIEEGSHLARCLDCYQHLCTGQVGYSSPGAPGESHFIWRRLLSSCVSNGQDVLSFFKSSNRAGIRFQVLAVSVLLLVAGLYLLLPKGNRGENEECDHDISVKAKIACYRDIYILFFDKL